jgi:hypothetical protein
VRRPLLISSRTPSSRSADVKGLLASEIGHGRKDVADHGEFGVGAISHADAFGPGVNGETGFTGSGPGDVMVGWVPKVRRSCFAPL